MAVFTSAAMGLRKKIITDALKRSGAVSAETAKTLAESGVENPDLFREYTEMLVAGDAVFASYLELQRFDEELRHLEDKYGAP